MRGVARRLGNLESTEMYVTYSNLGSTLERIKIFLSAVSVGKSSAERLAAFSRVGA